jgi:hypothetical protein
MGELNGRNAAMYRVGRLSASLKRVVVHGSGGYSAQLLWTTLCATAHTKAKDID